MQLKILSRAPCKVKEKRELMLFILNEEESTKEDKTTEGIIEEIVKLKLPEGTEIALKTIMGLHSKEQ